MISYPSPQGEGGDDALRLSGMANCNWPGLIAIRKDRTCPPLQQGAGDAIMPEQFTPTIERIEQHLYLPELPHIDVLVRTSGEQRISNFMLWQAAGSPVYFTDRAWPEFDAAELDRAIAFAN